MHYKPTEKVIALKPENKQIQLLRKQLKRGEEILLAFKAQRENKLKTLKHNQRATPDQLLRDEGHLDDRKQIDGTFPFDSHYSSQQSDYQTSLQTLVTPVPIHTIMQSR